jgi:CHAD domain-containing protein
MGPRTWITHARAALVDSLRAAAERFPPDGEEGADRIHEARKELKRAASLARLFAPIVGAPAYATLDAVDAARRRFSRARDLDILPGALGRVKCAAETRDILLRAIGTERGKARRERAENDAERFGRNLAAAATAVAAWELDERDDEDLLRSLRATYRSAKRRGRLAFATGDADDLHDLRSRVVDLGHQCALLEPAWPAMFAAQGAELHRLRQVLGEHNDLTLLGEFALARHELPPAAGEALVALVLRRRKPLEKRAAGKYGRLFAERPGGFARRLAGYLEHPQNRAPEPAREAVDARAAATEESIPA